MLLLASSADGEYEKEQDYDWEEELGLRLQAGLGFSALTVPVDETTRALPADINPYAPPSVPDPLLPDRGPIGAWRDGKYLVVHRLGGALPHICLLTGQPAEMRLPVLIRWSYPIDYSMRQTTVDIGLTVEASRKYVRYSRLGCAAHLVSVLGVILLVALGPVLWGPITLATLSLMGISTAAGSIISHYSQHLRFSKARGEYIWLRGAGQHFLDQLPPWPGTT